MGKEGSVEHFKKISRIDAEREMVMKCLIKLSSRTFIQLPMQMMFYVAPYFDFRCRRVKVERFCGRPVFFVIEDFYFYWIHRFLHHKSASTYTRFITNTSIRLHAEYAHPVETFSWASHARTVFFASTW